MTVAELVAGLADVGAATGDVDAAVLVDPGHFRRILRDLWWAAGLAPAAAAAAGGRRHGLLVKVRVIRDAEPIEPRILQALFDPFDVNDDATGVTIGLYLARALVVAHGGTLGARAG